MLHRPRVRPRRPQTHARMLKRFIVGHGDTNAVHIPQVRRKDAIPLDSKKKDMGKGERLSFYMDLVGHDVLNNNQAVLSYLELILASPAADRSIRRYAEKAAAHARSSTLLVEDIKRVLAVRSISPADLKTIDLVAATKKVEREAAQLFPSKSIRFENESLMNSAVALGGDIVSSILLNMMVDAIRMDQGDSVELNVKITGPDAKGFWSTRIENRNIRLPALLKGKGLESIYSQDSSRAVKLTGMVFAKMVTGMIGGNFEAEELSDGKGAVFVVRLKKGGDGL